MGGRQKGTPNRATADLRSWIEKLVNENREQIREDLEIIDAVERLKIVEKFISYILPKKKEVSIQDETDALLQAVDRLDENQLKKLEEIILNIIENGNRG